MIRIPFNDDWNVGPLVDAFDVTMGAGGTTPVRLPHDLLQSLDRSPDGDGKRAFFPSGVGEYTKRFDVPEEYADKRVSFEFDGVYRDAMVYINGDFAAQRPSGYSRFIVEADPFLAYGRTNEIRVVARTHDDSRWYPGLGIYREVRMLVGDLVHIEPHSVRVTTPDVDDERAIVATAVSVANRGTRTRTVSVRTRVVDPHEDTVAEGVVPVTVRAGAVEVLRQRMPVPAPLLWDVDTPHLYSVEVELHAAEGLGGPLDDDSTTFGIRTLRLDVDHGLRINGRSVELRGACIHHDNGVIGAAAIRRAEERQIELLKAAGFNAVRSAHNPLSSAQLDACDRIGMLVVDEAFDVWTDSKTSHDYALAFPEWFQRDLESLVAKDFNHPSVVVYSIGNEVNETRTPLGAGWSRRLAEHLRSLDPTRFITNSVNLFLSVVPKIAASMPAQENPRPGAGAAAASGFEVMGKMLTQVGASDAVSDGTAEVFATVDIAGFNYGDSRYEIDKALFPHRVILGTETFPDSIAGNWRLVRENPHVIGDFTWTGWDYIGEVGLGRPRYREDGDPMAIAPWPWRLAWCADIDITGHRRPASYYREIVFGLRREPYIAVRRPERHHDTAVPGLWTWSDSVSSWSWAVQPGSPVTVEVYSPDPEVELFVDGVSAGVRPAGPDHDFRAAFETTWQPGEIAAFGIAADGTRTTATRLASAGPALTLKARADRVTVVDDDGDLAFIDVTVEDTAATLATHADRPVTAVVTGPGVLQGFGSADPVTEETFTSDTVRTFRGRALAVVRPTGPGTITATFRSGADVATVRIEVIAQDDRPRARGAADPRENTTMKRN